MRVQISPQGLQDLDEIFLYLARDGSSEIANKFYDSFYLTLDFLTRNPLIGRKTKSSIFKNLYRLNARKFDKYLIFYTFSKSLTVQRIIHGSQDLMTILKILDSD
jgi:plasmid stabilization system protein ParE